MALSSIYTAPASAARTRVALIRDAAAQIDALRPGVKSASWLTVMASAARLAAALLEATDGAPVGDPEAGYLVLIERLAQAGAAAYATLARLAAAQPDKALYAALSIAHRAVYQHIRNSRGQSFYVPQDQAQPPSAWYSTESSPIRVLSAAMEQAVFLSGDWQVLGASGADGMEQALAIMASGVTVGG